MAYPTPKSVLITFQTRVSSFCSIYFLEIVKKKRKERKKGVFYFENTLQQRTQLSHQSHPSGSKVLADCHFLEEYWNTTEHHGNSISDEESACNYFTESKKMIKNT